MKVTNELTSMRNTEGYGTRRFVTDNLHCCAPCTSPGRPAAIDDQRRACHKSRFVRGEVERGVRDLVRSPHTPDRLASVEVLTHLILVAGKIARQVALHKPRLHRAAADVVAAHPLCGEVHGDSAPHRH